MYNKDLKKARKYFWGVDGAASSGARGNNSQPSLFGDRKGNNLFNGIWRMPLNEVDRAGSFSTHMGNEIILFDTRNDKQLQFFSLNHKTFSNHES